MNVSTRVWSALLLLGGLHAQAAGIAPTFASKPVVTKAGDGCEVRFAVKAETDVAVYVEDASSNVIRHLAAGVLGTNAPAPLKPNSLEQSLVWDGKDDLGRAPTNGPFRIRVGLGLKPALDKMLGFNPASFEPSVRALVVGPKSEVFVFFCFGTVHPNDNSMACSVFSRDGKYLRTIMPYPANLPEQKLAGLKRVELEDGSKVPFIYQAETRSFIPGAGDNENHEALATSDGRVAFVGRMEWLRYSNPGPLHLIVLNADGSVPNSGPIKTKIFPNAMSATLAMSPDEKTIYASDIRTSRGDHYGVPVHRIYKFGWDDKEATLFLNGTNAVGESRLNDPKGICTDKDGNLVVADKKNDRLAMFKPDGSFVRALPVIRPERVSISRKTGAIYVLAGSNINEVLKFNAWTDTAPAARTNIPFFRDDGNRISMAMDDSADPTVLWIGTHAGGYARYGLLRMEDRGGSLAFADIAKLPANKGVSFGAVRDVAVWRASETLYVDFGKRVNGRTGDPVLPERNAKLPLKTWSTGAIMGLGLDGFNYMQLCGERQGIYKVDRDFQPVPLQGGTNNYIPRPGEMRLRGRGITADARGNIYVLWQKPVPQQWNALGVYGPDGAARNEKLIDADIRSLNSVRVDYQGNIYLALGLRPGANALPPGLQGKLPDGPKDPDAVMGVNYYPMMYGSIAKFGPEGGLIQKGAGGVVCSFNQGLITEVKGAKWITPGASCVPSWRSGQPYLSPDICQCESPRFDVDGFGRSFFPDAARFRVGVLDTAGNEILHFGSYGNQDSAGPGSLIPKPEIAFCWIQAVGVSDEAIYVGDRLNRRIVRLKLGYEAEETCGVK
jgi:hypothetical protein